MTPPLASDSTDAPNAEEPVPLRVGAPCPRCEAAVEDLEFVSLPPVAIKREMYDVCVLDTDDLPTPWRHPTAVVYHEDPDPWSGASGDSGSTVSPGVE